MDKNKGASQKGWRDETQSTAPTTLSDLGISKDQSSKWQKKGRRCNDLTKTLRPLNYKNKFYQNQFSHNFLIKQIKRFKRSIIISM